jgi:hypothetical protein
MQRTRNRIRVRCSFFNFENMRPLDQRNACDATSEFLSRTVLCFHSFSNSLRGPSKPRLNIMRSRHWVALWLGVTFALLPISMLAQDAKVPYGNAATVAAAANVLALDDTPVVEGSDDPSVQQVTCLSYRAKSNVKGAYAFHKKQLQERGWKEQPQASVSDEFASGTFGRDGFVVSVTVMPATPSEPSTDAAVQADVRIQHHGNVDISKLPNTPDAKAVYVGPLTAIYTTALPPDKAEELIRTSLSKAGWVPYGGSPGIQSYRKAAVVVTAMTMAAPAQANSTSINYSVRMVPLELPAPPNANQLQFSDDMIQLAFDSEWDAEKIGDFYREQLAEASWKATTERMIEDRPMKSLILRNEAGDLLDLQVRDLGGSSRVLLQHQSAEQVEEETARAKAAAEAAMEKKNAPKDLPKVRLALPDGAKAKKQSASSAEWTVATGSAKKIAESLRASLAKDGWKETTASLDAMVGVLILENKDATLTIDYTDTGFLPAEFSIRASRCELVTK